MTDPAAPRRPFRLDARVTGSVLCAAGLLLSSFPWLLAGAVGLELLAAAFWVWARAAEDRTEQLKRWGWLRRPAAAMWLAAGIEAVVSRTGTPPGLPPLAALGPLRWIQAAALVWAGLELLAASPFARPFSDRPGPLHDLGPWLPVLLPSAGFALLWRHAARWAGVPEMRQVALFLLFLTAVLGALRAFSRKRLVASLRWLVVVDSSLAACLVALNVVPRDASLLLWVGACGGRAMLLAGELRGSAPRRTYLSHRLWSLSSWLTTASLSWPLLISLGFGRPGVAHLGYAVVAAFVVALSCWVTVRRLVEAPERRTMVRRESAVPFHQLAALLTILVGPAGLVLVWWSGFRLEWPAWALGLAPALVTGAVAWWLQRHPETFRVVPLESTSGAARGVAAAAFRSVVGVERRAVALLIGLGRALIAPSRDLHTGDAQEYLLFLVGLSVLALVLPLLR
ncbi:MAG TPA: hypothetical protein VGK93_07350 [Candidatus Eisenbacteria bacterium]|jgi:hypothetical protein